MQSWQEVENSDVYQQSLTNDPMAAQFMQKSWLKRFFADNPDFTVDDKQMATAQVYGIDLKRQEPGLVKRLVTQLSSDVTDLFTREPEVLETAAQVLPDEAEEVDELVAAPQQSEVIFNLDPAFPTVLGPRVRIPVQKVPIEETKAQEARRLAKGLRGEPTEEPGRIIDPEALKDPGVVKLLDDLGTAKALFEPELLEDPAYLQFLVDIRKGKIPVQLSVALPPDTELSANEAQKIRQAAKDIIKHKPFVREVVKGAVSGLSAGWVPVGEEPKDFELKVAREFGRLIGYAGPIVVFAFGAVALTPALRGPTALLARGLMTGLAFGGTRKAQDVNEVIRNMVFDGALFVAIPGIPIATIKGVHKVLGLVGRHLGKPVKQVAREIVMMTDQIEREAGRRIRIGPRETETVEQAVEQGAKLRADPVPEVEAKIVQAEIARKPVSKKELIKDVVGAKKQLIEELGPETMTPFGKVKTLTLADLERVKAGEFPIHFDKNSGALVGTVKPETMSAAEIDRELTGIASVLDARVRKTGKRTGYNSNVAKRMRTLQAEQKRRLTLDQPDWVGKKLPRRKTAEAKATILENRIDAARTPKDISDLSTEIGKMPKGVERDIVNSLLLETESKLGITGVLKRGKPRETPLPATKDIYTIVNRHGGLKSSEFKAGEWEDLPRGARLQMSRKDGFTADEMAQELESSGLIPKGSTGDDLREIILRRAREGVPKSTEAVELEGEIRAREEVAFEAGEQSAREKIVAEEGNYREFLEATDDLFKAETAAEREARVFKETQGKFAEEAASTETITERELRREQEAALPGRQRVGLPARLAKTSDEIEVAINRIEKPLSIEAIDKLDVPGTKLHQLYADRLKALQREGKEFINKAIQDSGLSPREAKSGLESAGIETDLPGALLQERLNVLRTRPDTIVEGMYNHFSKPQSAGDFVEFKLRLTGTPDKPTFALNIIGKTDPIILKKVEQLYNSVARNIDEPLIRLSPQGGLQAGLPGRPDSALQETILGHVERVIENPKFEKVPEGQEGLFAGKARPKLAEVPKGKPAPGTILKEPPKNIPFIEIGVEVPRAHALAEMVQDLGKTYEKLQGASGLDKHFIKKEIEVINENIAKVKASSQKTVKLRRYKVAGEPTPVTIEEASALSPKEQQKLFSDALKNQDGTVPMADEFFEGVRSLKVKWMENDVFNVPRQVNPPVWDKNIAPVAEGLYSEELIANRLTHKAMRATRPYFKLKKEGKQVIARLMWQGDKKGKAFTVAELQKAGHSPEVIKGYRAIRKELDDFWWITLRDEMRRDAALRTTDIKKLALKFDEIDTFLKDNFRTGYAPRMRFGDYAVRKVNKEGKSIGFDTFETKREMKAALGDLEATLPEGGRLSTFRISERYGGDPNHLIAMLDNVGLLKTAMRRGGAEAADAQELIDLMGEELLKVFARGRLAKRRGFEGYSKDLDKVLRNYFRSTHRSIVRRYRRGELDTIVNRVPKDGGHQQRAKDLIKYTRGEIEREGWLNQALRKGTYTFYLGLKPAFGMLNMTQRVMTAYWDGVAEVGLIQGSAAFGRAQRVELSIYKDMIKKRRFDMVDIIGESKTLTEWEKTVLLDKIASGEIDAALMREVGAIDPKGVLGLLNSFGRWSEISNRVHGAAMGANLAQMKGLEGMAGLDYTTAFLKRTHFQYGKSNRPELARGKLAPLFIFKTYPLNYVNEMKSLYGRNRGAWAGAVLTFMAMTGVSGMPLAGTTYYLLDEYMAKNDPGWIKRKRDFFKKFPKLLTRMGWEGVPSIVGLSGSFMGMPEILGAAILPIVGSLDNLPRKLFDNRLTWKAKIKGLLPTMAQRLIDFGILLGMVPVDFAGKPKYTESDIEKVPAGPLREEAARI
ncbi:hypothetical protein LCGC14_1108900, partial [marine sediment metagenome]